MGQTKHSTSHISFLGNAVSNPSLWHIGYEIDLQNSPQK